ncbi:MAG TPA: carbohydrate-binding protein [Tepidisphaeraceae bacterium]|jgi:hypothetical protein|nr:carbohydrate-binding protein [Tepidisphaeraceae bacterium]
MRKAPLAIVSRRPLVQSTPALQLQTDRFAIETLEPRTLLSAEPTFSEFMGINTHSFNGFDPQLYIPVASHVRDYHNMNWDVGSDTSYTTTFPFARNGVNWDREYSPWVAGGFRIDACIQLKGFTDSSWTNLAADAYKYGKAFASYFGPTNGNGLVRSVEIGNEEGQFSDAVYRQIFQNMAQGIRDGDAALPIATMNVTDGPSGQYAKNINLFDGLEHLVDVYNTHSYPFLTGYPTWERSYPEDARLSYLTDVQKIIDWKDAHDPTAQTWITEFGYDSSTKPNQTTGTFKDFKDVTDTQQAQYLVRSWLEFSRMDIDRAYQFWFNDSDSPTLYGGSGLTRDFQPKESYWAVAHLQKTLGDYKFKGVVQSTNNGVHAYAYERAGDPSDVIWAVWSATGNNTSTTATLSGLPGSVVSAERMPLASGAAPSVSYTKPAAGQVRLTVNESPTFIRVAVDGSIKGSVFNDADDNGSRGSSEAGVSGRTVYVDANNNGSLNAGERSTLTDGAGDYAFTKLLPGSYVVREVVPSGWTQTSPANNAAHSVTVAAGAAMSGKNFGTRQSTVTPPTTVTLQAESAALSGGTVSAKNWVGYNGNGFADFAGNGSAVQWTVDRAAAGSAKLEFRYANGSTGNRPLTVIVNGTNVGTLSFGPTGSWATWSTVSLNTALQAGNNTVRLVAGSAGGPNVDQLIVSPASITPSAAVYEAESAALSGGTVAASNWAGFGGSGFADFAGNGSAVQWTVNRPASGAVRLDFRYANGSTSNRPLTVIVNGTNVGTVQFGPTGNWGTWAIASIPATLNSGNNTIRLLAGAAGGPNVDRLIVNLTTAMSSPLVYQAEAATFGNSAISREHGGYTGGGYVDYGGNGSYVQFTVNQASAGSASLAFRYASGTTAGRPLTVSVNGVAVTTLSFGGTGGWNQWGTTTLVAALRSGSNTIRLTAGVAGGPNLDQLAVALV